jgi:phenylalanyl-tRNA synthetase beta chain
MSSKTPVKNNSKLDLEEYMVMITSKYEKKMIQSKNTKKVDDTNFVIPNFHEYSMLLECNYNAFQLKSVAKHHKLKVTGNKNQESWTNAQKPSDFFLFKGFVNGVLERLGIQKTENLPITSDVFSEGIAIGFGDEILVEYGVVKKSIIKHFNIKQEVLFADFNWALLLKLISNKIKFTEIPKYPEVRRDLSLLLDENMSFDSIYTIARQTEKILLKDINLFDVYQGKNLPEGKKSYAVSFTIQDSSKTLTDVQIDKIMMRLQKNLETELGAILR